MCDVQIISTYRFVLFLGFSWWKCTFARIFHYDDVIMGGMASQITSLTIFYSTVHSDADQRKNQSSASLAFVRGIHRRPVNSPHKWPVTRKMSPFDDVIMLECLNYETEQKKGVQEEGTYCFKSVSQLYLNECVDNKWRNSDFSKYLHTQMDIL